MGPGGGGCNGGASEVSKYGHVEQWSEVTAEWGDKPSKYKFISDL